ncbi:hypothetical protein BJY54_002365 [Streptomyces nodosus]|nr:hypothetical protein [Streptomyces nodosus]
MVRVRPEVAAKGGPNWWNPTDARQIRSPVDGRSGFVTGITSRRV